MTMPRTDLLPGVTESGDRRKVATRSRHTVAGARWRAHARDAAQLLLLGGVDWLFAHWTSARMPFLDRSQSLRLLLIINAIALTYVVLRRVMPYLAARRIAKSWSGAERRKHSDQAAASGASRFSRAITKR